MNSLSPDDGQAIEPTNAALAAMLQEQRDVISMMQIQLDMQKEQIGKQKEQIQLLQSQVNSVIANSFNFWEKTSFLKMQ